MRIKGYKDNTTEYIIKAPITNIKVEGTAKQLILYIISLQIEEQIGLLKIETFLNHKLGTYASFNGTAPFDEAMRVLSQNIITKEPTYKDKTIKELIEEI